MCFECRDISIREVELSRVQNTKAKYIMLIYIHARMHAYIHTVMIHT